MKSTIKLAAKFAEESNQSTENNETKRRHSTHKSKIRTFLKENLESKVMHRQYIRSVDRQLIGGEDMLLWMWSGDLKEETESEIIAAQD
jgi:hypothetical protein